MTIVGPLDLIFILGEIVGDIHVFHARSIIAQLEHRLGDFAMSLNF